MKILLVSDTSSHMRGGVPSETRILIQGLALRGHTVALLADAPLRGAEAATHWPLTLPVGAAFDTELKAVLADFDPDVVHLMQLSTRGLLKTRRLLTGRNWLATVHSVSPYERKVGTLHDKEWLHYAVRYLRFLPNTLLWKLAFAVGGLPKVIVHSRFVNDVLRSYGYDPTRLSIIPLPVEPERDLPVIKRSRIDNDGRLELVTVGGIAHTKGQHDVVQALPRIRQHFPEVRASFIGEIRDPNYARHLIALAGRLGIADHVVLLTQLTNVEKNRLLDNADVYVQPSHEEGFCLAFAEAAARLPRLVGTDTGAIAAMGQGDEGTHIVSPRNPDALATAIVAVACATLPVDLMQRRAARLATQFSTDGYIEAHERLYASTRR